VVWDLTSMSIVRYLRGHTAGINAVCYSPDGKRMATASADATVKIWDLTETQNAVSGVWRMTKPALTAGLIDAGQCFAGTIKDTLLPSALQNLGSAPVRIQSMRLTGGDSSYFTLRNSVSIQTITAGTPEALDIEFRPDAARIFTTTLEIITQNQVLRIPVRGEGMERVLGYSSSIDLGRVYVGDRRDTTIQVVVTNLTKQGVEITASTLTGDGQISLLSGGNDFTLSAGGTRTMTFSFAPTQVGTVTSTLTFAYKGFGSPAVLRITGEGVCSSGKETISAGSIPEILPEQIIDIPIILSFPANDLPSTSREYSFNVRYNATVLLPMDSTPVGTASGNDRIITFAGRQNGIDTLTVLRFATAVGTEETTRIAIENFKWTACGTTATAASGMVKVIVCTSGGPRLYNPNGQVASLKITPNDVKSGTPTINFHTPESGNVELAFVNFLGESTVVFSGNCTIGDYAIPMQVENLPAGVYFVRMTTPTAVLTERVVVR